MAKTETMPAKRAARAGFRRHQRRHFSNQFFNDRGRIARHLWLTDMLCQAAAADKFQGNEKLGFSSPGMAAAAPISKTCRSGSRQTSDPVWNGHRPRWGERNSGEFRYESTFATDLFRVKHWQETGTRNHESRS